MGQVMTSGDPRWEEFTGRLFEALVDGATAAGARRRDRSLSKRYTLGDLALEACNGPGSGAPYEAARVILADMGMDVERSLAAFRFHDAYCDCKILLLVDPMLDGPDGEAGIPVCGGPPNACERCRRWLTDPHGREHIYDELEQEYLAALDWGNR